MNLTSYSSEIEKKSPEEFEKKNLTELINNLYKYGAKLDHISNFSIIRN